MKVRVFVAFNSRDRPWPAVRWILVAGGLMAEAKKGPAVAPLYSAWFWEPSKELEAFRGAIANEGLATLERREYVFTKQEIETAPLLRVIVSRAPLLGGAPEDGTQYDLSTGCPHCGTGSKQVSPLAVPKSAVRQTGGLRETVFGQLVAAPRVAEAIRREGISGLRFGDVLSARTGERLSIRQAFATYELPRWSERTIGGELGDRICSVCRRDGHFDSGADPLLIAYERSNVEPAELPDVVHTWEHFDYSWASEERSREVWEHQSVELPTGGVLTRADVRLARPLVPLQPARACARHLISRTGAALRARDAHLRATGPPGTIALMADRAALERELEEIRAQLDWVRDYL